MSNEVTKTVTSAGVTNVMPEFMKGMQGKGTEGLSDNALTPPRIKLMQALSPELEEMDSLKPGAWLNNITMTDYGTSVKIIPCFMTEAYMLFAPRVPGATGGLLARSNDGIHWSPSDATFEVTVDKKGRKAVWKTTDLVSQSGLAAWGTSDPDDKNSPPAASHLINCVVLLADYPDEGPMVLSFTRSSLKIGKKFAGNLKLSRVPSFGRVFDLTSLKVSGPSGEYYEPRVAALGFVDNTSLFNAAMDIYQSASKHGVAVDIGDENISPAPAEASNY
jgi:hypothetical protein